MKRLLLVSLTLLLLLVGCGQKEDEPIEEVEVIEPLGYYGPFVIKAKNEIALEDLKDHKIGIAEYYDTNANEFFFEELAQYGVTEENYVMIYSYAEIPDNIKNNNFDCFIIDTRIDQAINDFRQDYIPKDYKVVATYDIPYYEIDEEKEFYQGTWLYNNPFAIMITGIDESVPAETTKGVRTDVNIAMFVNPEKRHVLTVSFPRDSYMLSSKYKYYDKMNAFIANGLDDTINSVANTLDTEIKYYVQVSFSSFIDIINSLGGVWVHVPYDVYIDQNSQRDVTQPYSIDKGYVKLYGEWALALARNRKYAGLVGGDYGRIRNQILIVNEIMARVTQYPTLLDLMGISWTYRNLVYTNFQENDIKTFVELGKKFAEEGYTVDNYFVENIGDMLNGSYVGYMPEWSLDIARGKIDLVLTGEVDEDSPYLAQILTGYVSKGAGTSADGGYLGDEYDLRKVFGLEDIDVELDLD